MAKCLNYKFDAIKAFKRNFNQMVKKINFQKLKNFKNNLKNF